MKNHSAVLELLNVENQPYEEDTVKLIADSW